MSSFYWDTLQRVPETDRVISRWLWLPLLDKFSASSASHSSIPGAQDILRPRIFSGGSSIPMTRKLDGLTTLLLATIFATLLLFSCAAKQAPRDITVKVPENYSGPLNLNPCFQESSATVSVDSNGSARTSACPKPGESVTLTVIQGGVEHRISPDQITIERAGDGLPVRIKTRVPAK